MSKLQTLVSFLLFPLSALAETVLWKATGTLTDGTGVFFRDDLPPDAPVSLRITYRDDAILDPVAVTFGRNDSDYFQDIHLEIEIEIGDYTWKGLVETADKGFPYTFFPKLNDPSPTPEDLEMRLDSEDQANFSSFPFRLGDSSASIFLDFLGTNSSFLGSGISPNAIDTALLSTATGTISTGVGNDLTFSIDPSSLEILFESDEPVAPIAPVVSASVTSDTVTLSWQSDFRFRYRVESTSDLSSETWDEIEIRNGTDLVITRDYVRAEHPNYFRVEPIERDTP